MYSPTSIDTLQFFQAITASGPNAVALIGVGIALVMLCFFLIPVITKIMLPVPKETRLVDHLPFSHVAPNGTMVVCQDGSVSMVIEIKGKEIAFMSEPEREELFQKRKRWFDTMAEFGVRCRIFTIREEKEFDLSTDYESSVLSDIAKKWNKEFDDAYHNRHIILLSSKPPKKKEDNTKNVEKILNDAAEATRTMLHDFGPRILNQRKATRKEDSPLAVLAHLVSPITRPFPKGMLGDVNEMIVADVVEFGADERGLIHFQSGDQHKYMGVMGIRNFGDFTDEDFISALGSVNGEITIMHMIDPWSKVKAAALLAQQSRMSKVTRFSAAAKDQFMESLEMIEGVDENRQTMATYQMIIFLNGNSPEDVQRLDSEIRRVCVNYGVTPVREGVAAQASWFAQLPSYAMWPRPFKFFSGNISALISFDRAPEGNKNCDWGNGPIAIFKTNVGTPYQFQFHISDEKDAVAHGIIIGPTGGGKTTLISFLTGMAMRHKELRCYMFDRYLGAYVFTNAANGSYINVDAGGSAGEDDETSGSACSLNPFQCEDTLENRAFLRSWLQGISGQDDSDSLEEIGRAVKLNFESGLEKSQRNLRTLHEVCFAPDKPVSKALRRWIDPQLYGNIFNAPTDTLDTGTKKLISFDFTRIYASEDLTQAMLSYLMHRIQATITERNAPALIFVDETEPLLKHPTFRDWFLKMLQEYRKRGAGVLSAFQRPEALKATGVSELIRGQAQTMFFLRNPQAQEKDYDDFSLTENEWNFIKGKSAVNLQRAVLIKRATGESVILDADLGVLGPHLKIFNSGRESVRLAEKLKKQFGDAWVTEYLDS